MKKRFLYNALLGLFILNCNVACGGNGESKAADSVNDSAGVEFKGTSLENTQDSASSSESVAESPVSEPVSEPAESNEPASVQAPGPDNTTTPPSNGKIDGIARLKAAYPDKIRDISNNTIYFVDGSNMVYDDGKEKDFVYMLDNSDPEDMFHEAYDTSVKTPGYLQDVGRSRSEQLFKKLYGNSKEAVRKQLVSVPWFGGSVQFSSSNGAAAQLKKVKAELDELVKKNPSLKPYLKSSGTFYWRNVRGANRLSAHSYGIAFDIGVDKSDYWLWKNKGASETQKITYHNRIPMEIVEVFEKYGFVWGGRWYHFDTMHFEYRPELNPPKK